MSDRTNWTVTLVLWIVVLCLSIVGLFVGCCNVPLIAEHAPWCQPAPTNQPPVVTNTPDVLLSCWLKYPHGPDGSDGEWATCELLRMSQAKREAWYDYLQSIGANSLFFTLSHTSAGITPYKRGFSGEFDVEKLRAWRAEVVEQNRRGLIPVLYLFDDQGNWHNESNQAEHQRFIETMVQTFNDLSVVWCTAMEPEEYWSTAYQEKVAVYLKRCGVEQVGVHTTQDRYLTASTDILFCEMPWHPREGHRHSAAEVGQRTARLIAQHPGKDIVMWEANWDADEHARAQGQAALQAGAAGAGTGF